MTAVREVISEIVAANPNGSIHDLALIVYDKVTKAEMLPLLEDAVLFARRNRTRATEHRITTGFLRQFGSSLPTVDAPDMQVAFRRLLHQSVRLGDGQETTWGKATVEEHLQRLEMLRAKRAGLDRTIRFHEQAVELLESTGASCLLDVVGGGEAAA